MSKNPPNINVIFKPVPNSSQAFALDSRAHHTLYEGTRGVGKTNIQLMRFRRRVGIGYGEYWRGVIFDQEFDNLADLVAQSKKLFYKFEDGARFISSPGVYKWTWPTGEELLLRHVKKEEDYEGFHGHEYPFIGWNELTKWSTPFLYDKFMSCNRSSFMPERDTPKDKRGNYITPNGKPLPPIPLEVFSTTNPHGPGHNWVKRRFITVAPRGTLVKRSTVVFDPKIQEEREVVKTQVTIFGSYKENIYLPAEYIAELDAITDPNLRRAWFYGDWDVVAGGALDDVWESKLHILPRFVVPQSWRVDRAFDWGSTHPFSVGWFAEANGEEAILEDGSTFCPPAGTIIQLFEWYGAKEIGLNEGLKLSAKDIAQGVIEREIALMESGWIYTQPRPGPADNQIRDVREKDVETIESKMLAEGIRWTPSDKSPGSRRNGLQILRDRLEAAKRGEGPGFYVMDCCQATINTVPWLQRDKKKPDDIDTTSEDHTYDMIRYRILDAAKESTGAFTISMPH